MPQLHYLSCISPAAVSNAPVTLSVPFSCPVHFFQQYAVIRCLDSISWSGNPFQFCLSLDDYIICSWQIQTAAVSTLSTCQWLLVLLEVSLLYCLLLLSLWGSILGQSVSFPCSVPWKPVSIFLLCFWISLFLAAIHYTCCSSSQLLLSSHIATVYVSFSLGLTSMSFCETHARLGVT